MIVNLAGLAWNCPSPSFFELHGRHIANAADHVDVSFAADTQCRRFDTRDQAVAMVAQAFNT